MTEQEFWDILHAPAISYPIFYRLYHDNGVPLFFSMEDLPGTYIEIDHETYSRNNSNVRIHNGCMIEFSQNIVSKLAPGETGTPCHPDDVSIVVAPDQPHQRWSKQTYGFESN